MSKCCNFETKV